MKCSFSLHAKVSPPCHWPESFAPDPNDRFGSAREFAHALSGILGGSQNSGHSQILLARAVKAAQGWMNGKPARAQSQVPSSQPSWDEVENQFSTMMELPMIEEELGDNAVYAGTL